jgi:dienelactone hydrolase
MTSIRPSQMRALLSAVFLTLLAVAFAADAAPLPAPHQVEIPAANVTLHAQLYKPDGNGPFPTVIALHGCGGLAGHSEPVLPRYRDWAEQFLRTGHAVLLPDSYGSRELGPQCRVKERERHVLARKERVADINAARQWLLQQPWAAHDRISLIGWANGASALLWAVRPQMSSPRSTEPDFRSAIAFYPDCRISSGLGWSARVPTLLLIGAKDDVSSPPCRQMVDGARGRSALTRIVVYPSAYHDFDRANLPVHAIAGTADAAAPERGHIGTDADARTDAEKLVAEWLAR